MRTIRKAIAQIEACGYTCEAGRLEDNLDWKRLRMFLLVLDTTMYFDQEREENQMYEHILRGDGTTYPPTAQSSLETKKL